MPSVTQFWNVGLLAYLGVPDSVQDQIIDSSAYSSEEERRMTSIEYYLQTVPGASWGEGSGSVMVPGGAHSPRGSQAIPPIQTW